jgi:tetratricopeptide (TPR) repeat protein
MKKPRLAIAGTLVLPRGAMRSRAAGAAGSQALGVVGGIAGAFLGAATGQVAEAVAERGVRGASPLEADQLGYLAVMPDSVVLFHVKQGWWSPKLTQSVIASNPRAATRAARLQRKMLVGILQITFADGSAWAFEIPRNNLRNARRVAAALGSDYRSKLARRAMTHERLGRYEQASADFDRLIQLDPTDAWALVRRGMAFLELGRHEQAVADFGRALELDATDLGALSGRGEAYRRLGRHQEALADLGRAIELDPGDDGSHYNYSLVLLLQDRSDEAKIHLRHAVDAVKAKLRKRPEDKKSALNLVTYYVALGNYTEARALYRTALAQGPGEHADDAIRDLQDLRGVVQHGHTEIDSLMDLLRGGR